MAVEDNGFMEYLQLQASDPTLVTKSELLSAVRQQGYSIGERQLSFYVSEGIVPKSVRVGSRAGAYPEIVVRLLTWVLRARDGGLTVEAIRELLPVWKLLVRARRDQRLDLGELEYVARQHVHSVEGSMAMPAVVSSVLHTCDHCLGCDDNAIIVVMKDGTERHLADQATTLGFAIARKADIGTEDASDQTPRSSWFAQTRISLAMNSDPTTDPTTLILGVRPNEPLPEVARPRRSEGEEDKLTPRERGAAG